MGIVEKIKEIEHEMSRTQKNKATEGHLGSLKAKLAKLRRELMEVPKKGPAGEGFDVMKSGDARVALIGFPSVGKSTLLSTITKTKSETAGYEFTTLTAVPGVIEYKGAEIQLLDLPGIIEGAAQGKGRGRQVIACARTSDMVLMMLDALNGPLQRKLLTKELEDVGIRLNQEKPNIYFKAKKTGGLKFTATCPLTHIDEKLVRRILSEYKLHNAEIIIRDDYKVDALIDVIEGNRVYMKCLYCYNKIDTMTIEEIDVLAREPHTVVISCHQGLNLGYLVERIWDTLGMVRVYTKRRGEPPDFSGPLVLRGGASVESACHAIHRTIIDTFKYALVWGSSAKHRPQRVGLSHCLQDEDVICAVQKGST